MLVLAVGVTEAAKQTGIDLSTVKQWSARGKWLAHTRVIHVPPPMPTSMQPRHVTGVTSPGDALENTLKERQNHTKLGLSLFAARAARVASKLPQDKLLARAGEVKAVADIASKVWPEVQGDTGMHVSFFSITTEQASEGPIIDVTPE